MAAAVAETARSVGVSVTLVRRVDDGLPWVAPDGSTLRVLFEAPWEGAHPLWGVAAAIDDADGDDVLILPCDLVGWTNEDTRWLVESGEAQACDPSGQRQPLIAVWRGGRFDARALREAAVAGRPVGATLTGLPLRTFRAEALRNANRPEDHPDGSVAAWSAGLPAGVDRGPIEAGERSRRAWRGVAEGVSSRHGEGR